MIPLQLNMLHPLDSIGAINEVYSFFWWEFMEILQCWQLHLSNEKGR